MKYHEFEGLEFDHDMTPKLLRSRRGSVIPAQSRRPGLRRQRGRMRSHASLSRNGVSGSDRGTGGEGVTLPSKEACEYAHSQIAWRQEGPGIGRPVCVSPNDSTPFIRPGARPEIRMASRGSQSKQYWCFLPAVRHRSCRDNSAQSYPTSRSASSVRSRRAVRPTSWRAC